MNNTSKTSFRNMTLGSLLTRLITSAIILAITAFFTPRISNCNYLDINFSSRRTNCIRLLSKYRI